MGQYPTSLPAVLLVSAVLLLNADLGLGGCFKRIFSFGDSIIDTGNGAYAGRNSPGPIMHLPYGMTYFQHPTGRISDGRVIVDFYAQALGLPLLPPSMPQAGTGQFPTGANFAVFGSLALSPDYYRTKYNFTMPMPWCLDGQLDSFKKVLARIAPGEAATKSLLGESLVVMGEIGGNDYNFWFFARRSREIPGKYMPDVIARIGAGVQEVIDLGARTVLVPGNFPIGCVPTYLGGFRTDNSTDYDDFRCLKWFNDFSQRHNKALKQEISRLRAQNPDAKIIYADYYGAAMEFVMNPHSHGIDDPLVACCGGAGPYHTGKSCNNTATIWGNPAKFASWDQIHMTEKAYSIIADGVLNGPYADTPLLHAC
ncbi:hypothetical protein QYE76_054261 [Lolium multiflorum]|uniref:GDSL esterase/lipase n=1 Tax=Lolium multiflorum TaxID=4521 RepID=A0AAD8SXS3_LOLMU|nr:hypothetical protein QYE76_054261 [Lolium multiflorum]